MILYNKTSLEIFVCTCIMILLCWKMICYHYHVPIIMWPLPRDHHYMTIIMWHYNMTIIMWPCCFLFIVGIACQHSNIRYVLQTQNMCFWYMYYKTVWFGVVQWFSWHSAVVLLAHCISSLGTLQWLNSLGTLQWFSWQSNEKVVKPGSMHRWRISHDIASLI